MSRERFKFPMWVKDKKHTEARQLEGEIHHKASIEECRRLRVCPDLAKAPINAKTFSDREFHMKTEHPNGRGNGTEFALYLLTLQPKLPGF